MRLKWYSLFVLVALNISESWSQEIPLGTWRVHLSYNDLSTLAVSNDRIFAASEIGIMIFDKEDRSLNTVTKIDRLNSSIITALAYDQPRDLLVIGHESGLITLLIGNQITMVNNLVVSSALTGSRKINHIYVHNQLAYLSTDFGVVVFDLEKKEVKETYRDLSDAGEALKINQSTVLADSLFLASEKGVIAGSLAGPSNLLDFRNWKRYVQGSLDNNIGVISVFNDALYVGIDTYGIFRHLNGAWQLQSFLQGEKFRHLSSPASNLVITTEEKVWSYNGTALIEIGFGVLSNPDQAIEGDDGFWVADAKGGLINLNGPNVTVIKPNGPTANAGWRINYLGNSIAMAHGGFSGLVQPLNREASLDQFEVWRWTALPTTTNKDVTDFESLAGVTYVSSFESGVERISAEGTVVFNDSNSPIAKINPSDQFIPITSIEGSTEGLWVANYGSLTPLHLLSSDLTWQSFSFAQPQASYPIELLVDQSGKTWMVIDPAKGGGIVVFEKTTNSSAYLTTQAGKGGLPSSSIRSIANDRDGHVWVGTDAGVVYYPNAVDVFAGNLDPVRPVFENRFLLRDESITSIAVDGGNRKWLGTNNGAWLFGPTGEELIYNFTEENSPILSNKIIDIAIDPKSGEVFFATDKGLVSFRSDATESSFNFSEVKIFPNPVSADFNGQVAINGLYTDAIVKITDISGRMVWQTQANGGTATWNARQLNGSRVSTGMYLVFATSEDGAERHVGKIAVIE